MGSYALASYMIKGMVIFMYLSFHFHVMAYYLRHILEGL
jgi:hypothetical protein